MNLKNGECAATPLQGWADPLAKPRASRKPLRPWLTCAVPSGLKAFSTTLAYVGRAGLIA